MAKGKKVEAPKDDFFDTPAERVDARKWEYEEGDVLAGVVVSVFEGDGDYGPYKGYIVEPNDKTTEAGGDSSAVSADDPLVWYVNENSAARRSIPNAGITVGDEIRVEYEGEKEAKNGRTFKSFNVKARTPELA